MPDAVRSKLLIFLLGSLNGRRLGVARRWKCYCLAGGFLAFICSPGAESASADYLSPDLRARVEKLKADADYLPTNAVNMEERARRRSMTSSSRCPFETSSQARSVSSSPSRDLTRSGPS